MRRFLLLIAAAIAGCGGGGDEDGGSAGEASAGGERTLTGCLELWKGPHVGSTRMKYLTARQTIYARVEIVKGRCRVSFASKDGKVYGRYIEKENITGPWTLEKDSAPVVTARKVVARANAAGERDGGLRPGAP